MSKPLRISCQAMRDVPPVEALKTLAVRGQHVVLVFPATSENEAEKQLLISRLVPLLPDHSVFNSGGTRDPPETWVTIKPVLSQADILENAALLTHAAQEFRRAATECMNALATQLGVSLEAFADEGFIAHKQSYSLGAQTGVLSDGGRFMFHGGDCGFTTRTGQTVEVKFGFPGEFGVLDPYFFVEFLRTTPGLGSEYAILRDGFHDAARALDVLHQHGYLIEVAGQKYGSSMRGWVARDASNPVLPNTTRPYS